MHAQALPVAQTGRGKRFGIVPFGVEVRGEDALQREIARQQGRVGLQANGPLLQLAREHLARRAQVATEPPDRLPADHPLCQAERGQENGQDECREGNEDRRPQTASRAQNHGSARLPCTPGRDRAGDRVSVKFTFATSSRTWICRAVSSGFTLLWACQTTNV